MKQEIVRVSLRMEPALHGKLCVVAKEEGRSRHNLLLRLIEKGLREAANDKK